MLGAPYPNPSTGAVTVPVQLGAGSNVRLVAYDVLGRTVAVLYDGRLEPGPHRFVLEAALPAGVYLVRATAGRHAATRRLTLLE